MKQDGKDLLAPDMLALVDALEAANLPPLVNCTPKQARALVDAMFASMSEAEPVEPVMQGKSISISLPDMPTASGLLTLPNAKPKALIVYFHGGGWVVGSPENYRTFAHRFANATSCAILMPHYRLAPEFPFPAAIVDAIAAVDWVARHCEDYVGMKLPLFVAGDSAGGNLATVAAQRAAGDVEIAGQLLIYPVTDHDFGTSSYTRFADAPILGRSDMQWFWDRYVPNLQTRNDPMASPIKANISASSPPAVIVAAEVDPLVDEGRAYADRLAQAGVSVSYRLVRGVTHGFITMGPAIAGSGEAIAYLADEIDQIVLAHL